MGQIRDCGAQLKSQSCIRPARDKAGARVRRMRSRRGTLFPRVASHQVTAVGHERAWLEIAQVRLRAVDWKSSSWSNGIPLTSTAVLDVTRPTAGSGDVDNVTNI